MIRLRPFRWRRQSVRETLVSGLSLSLLWLLLSLLGLGWLYPWLAPWIPAIQPALERPAVVAPAAVLPEIVLSENTPPPAAEMFGWAGPQVAEQALAELGDRVQVFSYSPPEIQEIAEKRVVLWPFVRATNKGRDPPNIPQPAGDCVSRGWSHGCEIAQATHLWLTGQGEFRRVYPPYVYGISRVQIGGGRLRGDGSTGAWANEGVKRYGLHVWTDDLPYNASIVREWGAKGPPKEFIERAKAFKADTRLITDFDAACLALSHGWPVPVCSSQGFQKIVVFNDRIEGRPSGTWHHCMVFIGYDTRAGKRALYCLNSWGPNAHAAAEKYEQLDGAPPGGFWVPEATANRMLAGRDSYAVSFHGFDRQAETRAAIEHEFGMAP